MKARVDNMWYRCGQCGHKLGRVVRIDIRPGNQAAILEVKCHSCGTLNDIVIKGKEGDEENENQPD